MNPRLLALAFVVALIDVPDVDASPAAPAWGGSYRPRPSPRPRPMPRPMPRPR